MSNVNFLILDVIYCVSGTMITSLSQEDAIKVKCKQFSEFCCGTKSLEKHHLLEKFEDVINKALFCKKRLLQKAVNEPQSQC